MPLFSLLLIYLRERKKQACLKNDSQFRLYKEISWWFVHTICWLWSDVCWMLTILSLILHFTSRPLHLKHYTALLMIKLMYFTYFYYKCIFYIFDLQFLFLFLFSYHVYCDCYAPTCQGTLLDHLINSNSDCWPRTDCSRFQWTLWHFFLNVLIISNKFKPVK